MHSPIPLNSIWKDRRSGLPHFVIGSGHTTKEHEWEQDEDLVITWSFPLAQPLNDVAGFSWMGPSEDFLRAFVMVK